MEQQERQIVEPNIVFTPEYWEEVVRVKPLHISRHIPAQQREQAKEAVIRTLPALVDDQLTTTKLAPGTVFAPTQVEYQKIDYARPGTLLIYDFESLRHRPIGEPFCNIGDPTLIAVPPLELLKQAAENRPANLTYHLSQLTYSNQKFTYHRRVGLIYVASNNKGEIMPIEVLNLRYRPDRSYRLSDNTVTSALITRAMVGRSERYDEAGEYIHRLRSIELIATT